MDVLGFTCSYTCKFAPKCAHANPDPSQHTHARAHTPTQMAVRWRRRLTAREHTLPNQIPESEWRGCVYLFVYVPLSSPAGEGRAT